YREKPIYREMGFSTRTALKLVAATAALTALVRAAHAQYACPPGYAFFAGVCQPGTYSNPLWGAAGGMGNGAAAGAAPAGTIGAVVGAAFGLVAGALAGTANPVLATVNALNGDPVYQSYAPPALSCPPGMMLYNGWCYLAR